MSPTGCSARVRELRLSDDQDGILRLNDVAGAEVGRPLVEALGIRPDVVFDVSVEANRPDAWCMAGVARDLATRLGLPFSIPDIEELAGGSAAPEGGTGVQRPQPLVGAPVDTLATVAVDDLELCPRFTARVITGVGVAPSPDWLARRLVLAGMRPINNVVDASNYVMLELGNPPTPTTSTVWPATGWWSGGPDRGRRWSPWTAWSAPWAVPALASATPARTA